MSTRNEEPIQYRADTCQPLRAAVERGEVQLHTFARGGYPGRPLPARLMPGVRSVGSWDTNGRPSWGLDWHRNEGIELTYLTRGHTAFEVEGHPRYTLRRGDLTITRPWQLHRVGDPTIGACRLSWLIMDVGVRRANQSWRWPDWLLHSPADLQRLTRLLRHNERPFWRATPEVARSFEKLTAAVNHGLGDPSRYTWLKLHVNELFVLLLEMLEHQQITLDVNLSSTYRTIEIFLLRELPRRLEEVWSIEQMAAECGLARSRFAHYCHMITNMTPVKYLTQCRVQAAACMLRQEPTQSITAIAAACGFATSQYFATIFRREMGLSPRSFRGH